MPDAEKKALRRAVEEIRRHLDSEYLAESGRVIIEKLLELPQYKAAKTVFCFVGRKTEIDTKPFILQALRDGKRVCVPKCVRLGEMHAREIAGLSDLGSGMYGIEEPKEHCPVVPPGKIDLAAVPCAACNKNGFRLGYGGGFYDRYLKGRGFFAAVLCRRAFIIEDIPVKPHDVACDAVITD